MDNKRLVLEFRAMNERWAALSPRLVRDPSGQRLGWEMVLKADGNTLPIRIEYPADYPASPPGLFACTSMPPGVPHLLSGNRICWYYPGESNRVRNTWDPGRDTAALCVGVAAQWFNAFLVWISTHEWPVRDATSGN